MNTPPLYETKVLQNEDEFAQWLDILKQEQVRSYLEIGSHVGGSLWRVANALGEGARLTAVDLPSSELNRESLMEATEKIRSKGQEVKLFLGHSMDFNIVGEVRRFGPYDAVFIDGDHSMQTITADWQNYGCMGRIVAFHDISWRRDRLRQPGHFWIEVPEFWNRIKQSHRHIEIKLQHKDNGIGVLWRS